MAPKNKFTKEEVVTAAMRVVRSGGVGALVWFARIIEWEFPGFCVERCRENLLRAQRILDQTGVIERRIHRFLLVCAKRA